jgi:hypothetical protein
MKIKLDVDIAPGVMQGAMDEMLFALMAERPLNDLERLGWLVVCKYVAERLPKDADTPKGDTPCT